MIRGHPQPMMGMNGTAFIAPPNQPGQPPQPPQQHLSLLGGNQNPNPPMSLLGGGAQQNANGPTSYQLQMQQQMNRGQVPQHRNPGLIQPGHPTAGMNPGMAPNPTLANGLGSNQLQQMSFQNPILPNNLMRRAPSQPQSMNPAGMAGMHPGQPTMSGMPNVANMAGLDMNTRMRMHQQQQQQFFQRQHMQQQAQQHQQHQQQQSQQGQHQMQGPGGIPPDMILGGRSGPAGGPFPIARAGSQPQPGPGIPQPPSLPHSHPGNIQAPFSQPLPLNQQHQQHQHQQQHQQHQQHPINSTSPHPPHTNVASGLSNGIPGNSVMPSNAAQNHTRMTPPDFMGGNMGNFPGVQMGAMMQRNVGPMGGSNGPQFPFGPAPNSPNNLGDLQPSMSSGQMSTPRAASQPALIPTPAKALDISQGTESFSVPMNPMGPPMGASVPARPPSQQRLAMHMVPQQMQGAQPQPPHPRQQTPLAHQHRSPRQPNQLVQQQQMLQGQRPPSQPQVPPRQSPQQAQQQVQHHQQQQQPTPQQSHQQLHQQPHQQPQQQQQQQPPPQQPQPQQQQPQAGPSRTPRTVPHPLPPNTAPPGRAGPPAAQVQQGPSVPTKPPTPAAGGQQVPIASRPVQTAPPGAVGPAAGAVVGPMQGRPTVAPNSLMGYRNAIVGVLNNPFFLGPGTMFLEHFSCALEGKSYEMLSLDYWNKTVSDFFSLDSLFKFTLWKDSMKQEAKPFEIGRAILPRFFLVTTQSGVTSMRLSLQGASETKHDTFPDVIRVECSRATWTFTYSNGYTINLRGAFSAHVRLIPGLHDQGRVWKQKMHPGYGMKIVQLMFDAEVQEKYLALDAVSGNRVPESPGLGHLGDGDDDIRMGEPRLLIPNATIPVEPVNAFGIPQATMRCLELAESVTQMSDLIEFSKDNELGPRDALIRFAQNLRDNSGRLEGSPGNALNHLPHNAGGVSHSEMYLAGMPTSSSALYPGPPTGIQPPTPQHHLGSPAAINGTPKPSHAVTHPPQASGSTPGTSAATPASAPTPTAMTPVTQPATLKRKNPGAGDAVSPTTSNSDPPKRAPRKRTRTQNGP